LRYPLLVSVLLIAGCSSSGPNGQIGSACSDDAPCKEAGCLADEAFPDNYCTRDCATDEAACGEGASCSSWIGNKFCFQNCSGDGDCRSGYACSYSVCRPYCADDSFCISPDHCGTDGHCLPPCKLDTDCPNSNRCALGKCVGPCTTDKECPPGYRCGPDSGRCDPKPGKQMGEACGASTECATDYCMPTRKVCSIKCTASSQCPSPWVCGLEKIDANSDGKPDQIEADCIPKQGSALSGALCSTQEDCVSGHCYDGFCMEACAGDGDCGKNACVDVNVVLTGTVVAPYKGCLPRQGVGGYFTIGTFPAAGSTQAIDVPPGAQSFVLSLEVDSLTEFGDFTSVRDPTGVVLNSVGNYCSIYTALDRWLPAEQYNSILVPNTPSVVLKPGKYTFGVRGSTTSLDVTARLQLRLGQADKGKLGINWFFLNLTPGAGLCIPGARLNAASAPTHPWLTTLRQELADVYNSAGITIGPETYHDLNNAALDVITLNMTGGSPELQQLFQASAGMQGNSINIFIVRQIAVQGMSDGSILGIAGNIPGPIGVHGLAHSGIAFNAETVCYKTWGVSSSQVLAHELGHYLGLFHNMEAEETPGYSGGQVVCPCPCGANMTCYNNQWCRGMDPLPDTDMSANNLMFWEADSSQSFKGGTLSPQQIRVMLDNPIVGH
jgi:hypothetical protein